MMKTLNTKIKKIFIYYFILSVMLLLTLANINTKLIAEVNSFYLLSSGWSWSWYIDGSSLIFSLVVLWISSIILFYSFSYMESEKEKMKFFTCMVLFILSMYILIFSFSLSSILIGWDGLGVSSFLLVFYYHSTKSINSSLITILVNRVGDLFIIFSIGLSMVVESWNLFIWESGYHKTLLFLLFFAGASKSAQIPFSSWLPKAMAAPTPVSSLVHSSTLVTAGVYLLYRLPLVCLMGVSKYAFFFSSLTLIMSSILSFLSFDCKEIVAFSTMSHMSLMMMSLLNSEKGYAFFHLCSHALFKALMFMSLGVLIFKSSGTQDIRVLNMNNMNIQVKSSFFVSSFSMAGIPFMSGFYSKDGLVESLFENFYSPMFMSSIFLTMSYTVRLFYYIMSQTSALVMNKSLSFMESAIYVQSWAAIMGGSAYLWLNGPLIFLPFMSQTKLLVMLIMIMGASAHYANLKKIKKIFSIYDLWLGSTYSTMTNFKVEKMPIYLEKGWISVVSFVYFEIFYLKKITFLMIFLFMLALIYYG